MTKSKFIIQSTVALLMLLVAASLCAAAEDMGLAQVPGPIAASLVKAGKLVQVLEPFAPMAPGVFLYYPSRYQMMPKLRAFIDHVKSRLGATNKTLSHIDDKRTRGMKMR